MSNHMVTRVQSMGRPIMVMAVFAITILCGHFSEAEQPGSPQALEPRVISPSPGEILRPLGPPTEGGRDLTGFTSWLQGIGTEDPDHVFTVKDGVLHISGEGMGYLATVDRYKNYHLSLEYRWGEKVDGSGYVRNSGILLHATGPDGNAKGLWMASVECQLAQGCEGDLIVIRGNDASDEVIPVTVTSDTILAEDGKTRWSPTGKKTLYAGKQFWWSRHQAHFEERVDTRGKDDVANPLGEWTRVDCLCQADRITIKINGVTVNECYDVFPASGKILFECEGNEIFFRNIEIRPLSKSNR